MEEKLTTADYMARAKGVLAWYHSIVKASIDCVGSCKARNELYVNYYRVVGRKAARAMLYDLSRKDRLYFRQNKVTGIYTRRH